MKKAKKKSNSTVTEKKTAKRKRRKILLLVTDTELAAIVKVEGTCQNTDPDSPFPFSVFCKALDSFGLIYDLELRFSSETLEGKENILTDLARNSIHLVKGQYSVFKKTFSILILDPEVMPIPADIPEADISEAFRINIKV